METCPFCGADRNGTQVHRVLYYPKWACGTYWWDWTDSTKHWERTNKCYETQITALQAQIAEIKEKLVVTIELRHQDFQEMVSLNKQLIERTAQLADREAEIARLKKSVVIDAPSLEKALKSKGEI